MKEFFKKYGTKLSFLTGLSQNLSINRTRYFENLCDKKDIFSFAKNRKLLFNTSIPLEQQKEFNGIYTNFRRSYFLSLFMMALNTFVVGFSIYSENSKADSKNFKKYFLSSGIGMFTGDVTGALTYGESVLFNSPKFVPPKLDLGIKKNNPKKEISVKYKI